jgi:hypothetical protein
MLHGKQLSKRCRRQQQQSSSAFWCAVLDGVGVFNSLLCLAW